MPQRTGDELLTAAETCRYLKIAPRTLYRYIRERRMPGFKLGKEWGTHCNPKGHPLLQD